ncbi:phosphate ABC transporter permease PstA [Cohaesibacter celericrescens]|uniref:Phosphate transport system permease protein PstA n=1 Tax=Cohaesibacter celericrescens TaxID=2067669 RepID=A0A2N5XML8_9HYPH|nr:phosphate ABC transporter permease PstA [Cohaesibacter celericrescens]PLW75791.1 phosphate ABC transporter, permease protein PstA [Cohaesibacter celericrescens]
MTDTLQSSGDKIAQNHVRDLGLKRRYAKEKRFRLAGIVAISMGILFLFLLFWSIVSKGYTAFEQTKIKLDLYLQEQVLDPSGTRSRDELQKAIRYNKIIEPALYKALGIDLTDKKQKSDRRLAKKLLSRGSAIELRDMVLANPDLIGKKQTIWVLAAGDVDSFVKGQVPRDTPEKRRKIKNKQIVWIDDLIERGVMEKKFNTGLFTFGASSRAETAGIGVAAIGSIFMMAIVLLLALPIGVAASIYLEEFAPKNRWTDLIEVNINNLAAVPSIVFGLLGLAVFINFAGLPRSASIVGGLVLTLMTLPTIIIATRSALKAVPPSIREAALGIGASKTQAIFHHVLPLATPGILTGTIIGLAQALGETAPLLMIGMVAFVKDFPLSPFDPATALPVQIYMWAGAAERAFVERTSAAIMILLAFLAVMNISAVLLRRRFERRW